MEIITSDVVSFKCKCGRIEYGSAEDVRIFGNSSDDGGSKYSTFISNSSFDPTTIKVKRQCSKCPLDYMTQIQIGPNNDVIYTCKCGNKEITT